ncbi:hypothetical protein JCM6882_001937 [Rhodosporidiobolus microsporus]
MLRTLSVLTLGGLLAATVSAAPSTCSGARFLDSATGTCQPCVGRTVKTCSSATVATSCVSRYYLTADGQCVANGQCPDATFADKTTGTCAKCYSPTYKTCSSAAATAATSCMNNTCLPATGGRCLPLARIASTSYCTPAGTVAACPGTGVKTCKIDGTPLTCASPYFLNPATAAMAAACVPALECPTGTFADESTRTCTPCGEGASRCTVEGAEQCSIQTDYFNRFTNSCTGVCPDTASFTPSGSLPSTYPDEASMTCSACQGDNIYRCDQTTGFAAQCPGKLVYEPYTESCGQGCYASAREVDGIAIPAEYISEDGKICLACKSENARECDQSTGLARSCLDGYFFLNSMCYTSCPEGMKVVEGACVDQSYCPYGLMYEPYTQQCGEVCYASPAVVDGVSVPAEYPSKDRTICLVCTDDKALECNQSTGLAVSCIDGYTLSDNKCVEKPAQQSTDVCVQNKNHGCPAGQYYDCWRKQCVDVCEKYATPVADGSIIPALWPDASTMTCKACNGGPNVYECNGPDTTALGLSQACFNSYLMPYDILPAKFEGRTCLTKEGCLSIPGYSNYVSPLDAPFDFSGYCEEDL